jgi:hypothetical protein
MDKYHMSDTNDLYDAIKLWAFAILGIVAGAAALSLAPLVPLPLTIGLNVSGTLVLVVGAIYLTAGSLSMAAGIRTIWRNRHA